MQQLARKTLSILGNDDNETKQDISEEDVTLLCNEMKRIVTNQPVLLKLDAPITIFGDLHGQFKDLKSFLLKSGTPPEVQILLLGDYVDRGQKSIEILLELFSYKILYPERIWILRGNHECREISRQYGFYDECCSKYSEGVWETFNMVFDFLPIAAVVSQRIFCVHGGLSPQLSELQQIENMKRPLEIPERGLIVDLLWSDPSEIHDGWVVSERGTSFTFGPDVVDTFLARNKLDLICRAHQVTQNGYEFPFFPNKSTVTVFSAPLYCGSYDNNGAIMQVDEQLRCSFTVIEPVAPPGTSMMDIPADRDF